MDALALALIGLGVVVVIIVLAISTGAGPRARSGTDQDLGADSVPTFSVVALGLMGAGKTVLLASQSHTLRPAAGRQYFLDGDLQQNRSLAELFSEVNSTSAPWPSATHTTETRELLFDCKAVNATGRKRTVFRISYLDYAGDILDPGIALPADEVTAPAGELQARVESAHALLVMLDGSRVLQLLRDEDGGHDYFNRRLWPLLALANSASCPVQLIVTKWDLVRSLGAPADDDDLLRQVSRRLMAYESITQLVDAGRWSSRPLQRQALICADITSCGIPHAA